MNFLYHIANLLLKRTDIWISKFHKNSYKTRKILTNCNEKNNEILTVRNRSNFYTVLDFV